MEIGPLKRGWIGCVEARDALNVCFKLIEASLLYQCGKLRAKAARSVCLMYDHAPAGFPHRNLDGFDVERNECAQVDNLRIYVQIGYGAGNHMNHGAIAKNGKRLPFPYYPRLAQVDAIIAIQIGRASCRARVCQYG